MCELTQPPPGIILDFHPNLAWAVAAVWLGIIVPQALSYRAKALSGSASRDAIFAWRLGLGACLIIAAALTVLALVLLPSDSARRLWLAQQQAALSPDCVATVLAPANAAASTTGFELGMLCVFVPVLIAAGMFVVARSRVRSA